MAHLLIFPPSFNQSGCCNPSHHICVLVRKKVESGRGMVCLIDCSYPSLRLQLCHMIISTEREVDGVSSYLGTLLPYTKWRFLESKEKGWLAIRKALNPTQQIGQNGEYIAFMRKARIEYLQEGCMSQLCLHNKPLQNLVTFSLNSDKWWWICGLVTWAGFIWETRLCSMWYHLGVVLLLWP